MTITRTRRAAMAALALALAAGTASPAFTQTETQPGVQSSAHSQEKLKSFAVAFLKVSEVNETYTARLQTAQSAEEQQQIRTEANQKMVEAVEDTGGISVEEYGTILQQAQSDPQLVDQINTLIGEASGETGTEPAQ